VLIYVYAHTHHELCDKMNVEQLFCFFTYQDLGSDPSAQEAIEPGANQQRLHLVRSHPFGGIDGMKLLVRHPPMAVSFFTPGMLWKSAPGLASACT